MTQLQWATVAVASTYYGVSEKTVRRWIAAGILEAKRVGPRLIRVNVESLDRLGRPLQYTGGDAA